MKRVLHHILEDYLKLDQPFEVLICKNKKFGDFSSNALLKYKINCEVNQLKSHPLIEHAEVVNGHLNIFLSTDFITIDPLSQDTFEYDNKRMKQLLDRLNHEGYHGDYILTQPWYDMMKILNLLNMTMVYFKVTEDEIKEVLDVFNTIDTGYIYRHQSPEVLSGVQRVLAYGISIIERI